MYGNKFNVCDKWARPGNEPTLNRVTDSADLSRKLVGANELKNHNRGKLLLLHMRN